MKAIDIGLIQARRAKLTSNIESHRSEIATLEAKLSELEIAERVFAELSLESDETVTVTGAVTSVTDAHGSNEQKRPDSDDIVQLHRSGSKGNKPEGLPSIPDMILEAIRHTHGLGAPGLDPAGLTSFIRGRHWPSVLANVVGPTAWRMWKRGELAKDGSVYSLPNPGEHRGADENQEISQPFLRRTLNSDLLSGVSAVALSTSDLTH
jgi:hypothetical protein